MPLNFVTISGSFQKFPDELARDMKAFTGHDITVLSPESPTIVSCIDGFVSLKGDPVPRIDLVSKTVIVNAMKTVNDGHLQAILQSDALWLMVPDGYCGPSMSLEMGWALAHRVPVFYDGKYSADIREPVVRMYARPIKGISDLVRNFDSILGVHPTISEYWMGRVLSPSVLQSPDIQFNANVAVGSVIVDFSDKRYRSGQPRDVLAVRTYKYGDVFSIVGDRMERGENLIAAFPRATREQTGQECEIGDDVCAFDEVPDSGYYKPGPSRLLVDKVIKLGSRRITLDYRAQEEVWAPPDVLLRDLPIEPNARKALQLYMKHRCLYG